MWWCGGGGRVEVGWKGVDVGELTAGPTAPGAPTSPSLPAAPWGREGGRAGELVLMSLLLQTNSVG